MNLKEAFRFQNKLDSLIGECCTVLGREQNIMQVENTYLRKKVMEGAEDETVRDVPANEYAGQINSVVEFVVYLLTEKEKLCAAVHTAKSALPVDMDSQTALNGYRQRIAGVFRTMSELRGSEQVISGGGIGYRFNAEGNQVSYKCDVRRVKTINYDRKRVHTLLTALNRTADEYSAEIDRCLVTSDVAYAAPFDVNDSFIDIFENFAAKEG